MKIGGIFCAMILTFLLACQEDKNDITSARENDAVTGSWLWVEYGYSPGAGYVTNPVSPEPPQMLTFREDGTMESNIESWGRFRFYRILEDTAYNEKVLAVFEEDPGSGVPELADSRPTYTMRHDGPHLTLSYRWCIEGCHLKFLRVDAPSGK